MSKHKKKINTKPKKQSGFSVTPLLLCFLTLILICAIGYFVSKDSTDTNVPSLEEITVNQPEITDEGEGEEEEEEQETEEVTEPDLPIPIVDIETIPVSEEVVHSLQMGENVLFTLYTDGTLKVTGEGSVFLFATTEDCYAYYGYRLNMTEITEMHEFWFDKVTKIEVEESVDGITEDTFSLYKNAEKGR